MFRRVCVSSLCRAAKVGALQVEECGEEKWKGVAQHERLCRGCSHNRGEAHRFRRRAAVAGTCEQARCDVQRLTYQINETRNRERESARRKLEDEARVGGRSRSKAGASLGGSHEGKPTQSTKLTRKRARRSMGERDQEVVRSARRQKKKHRKKTTTTYAHTRGKTRVSQQEMGRGERYGERGAGGTQRGVRRAKAQEEGGGREEADAKSLLVKEKREKRGKKPADARAHAHTNGGGGGEEGGRGREGGEPEMQSARLTQTKKRRR